MREKEDCLRSRSRWDGSDVLVATRFTEILFAQVRQNIERRKIDELQRQLWAVQDEHAQMFTQVRILQTVLRSKYFEWDLQ